MSANTRSTMQPDAIRQDYVSASGYGNINEFLYYAPDSDGTYGISGSDEKRAKILYIEDDLNNAMLMKRVLEADGHCVSLAPSGNVGLDKANREHPDLILLDIYMPGMNGHEVARRLRQMDDTRNTPILVISASPNLSDKRLSKEVGCNGYISKPIDVDSISNQVAAYL